jgi:hypothetical protein
MSYRAKEWAGPGIVALIGVGFQVCPIESMLIAIVIWSVAAIWAIFVFIRWPPIWTRLAFVKIEVQSSGIRGIYPPLPDNLMYGRMEPLEVKFELSSRLRVQLDSAKLCIDESVFESHNFCHEAGRISGVIFEIPINWFKGKSRKAHIIVATKGRKWRSKEFTIKVDD